jgi:hypothetical protein
MIFIRCIPILSRGWDGDNGGIPTGYRLGMIFITSKNIYYFYAHYFIFIIQQAVKLWGYWNWKEYYYNTRYYFIINIYFQVTQSTALGGISYCSIWVLYTVRIRSGFHLKLYLSNGRLYNNYDTLNNNNILEMQVETRKVIL